MYKLVSSFYQDKNTFDQRVRKVNNVEVGVDIYGLRLKNLKILLACVSNICFLALLLGLFLNITWGELDITKRNTPCTLL